MMIEGLGCSHNTMTPGPPYIIITIIKIPPGFGDIVSCSQPHHKDCISPVAQPPSTRQIQERWATLDSPMKEHSWQGDLKWTSWCMYCPSDVLSRAAFVDSLSSAEFHTQSTMHPILFANRVSCDAAWQRLVLDASSIRFLWGTICGVQIMHKYSFAAKPTTDKGLRNPPLTW